MKIVVVSDSHGHIDVLENIMKDHPDAVAYIHCGDIELPDDYFSDFIKVRGNNDFGDLVNERVIKIGDLSILITHSHRYVYYSRQELLAAKAKELGCQLVCFGHTHVFHDSEIDGVRLVNPGSCWSNRDWTKPSYALVYYEQGRIRVERVDAK